MTAPQAPGPCPPCAGTLDAGRLVLRPVRPADAALIAALAGDRRVSNTTTRIPYPLDESMVADWIEHSSREAERGRALILAITLRGSALLVGLVSLLIDPARRQGELGYWIAPVYWRRGYATEAARAVVRHAFEGIGLSRLRAECLRRNPASAAVLRKAGFSLAGCSARYVKARRHVEQMLQFDLPRDRFDLAYRTRRAPDTP